MFDHSNYNEALLEALQTAQARIEASGGGGLAWEPDPDALRDLMLERQLDREIERQAAEKRVRRRIGPVAEAATGRPRHDEEASAEANHDNKVIQLAERAQEVLEITELEPYDGVFIGKHINPDGSLTQYPKVFLWRQRVERVPATIPHLFAQLCAARERNVCLIRGAPANPDRQPTRRQKAGLVGDKNRGDHGFLDTPTRLFFLDVDGVQIAWRADPEGAIKTIVGLLGEPWASTSFVWFFSAKHGLEFDDHNRWTGKIIDGKVYARIGFITERILNEAEAGALTNIAKVFVPKIDVSISRQVQVNYIKRPHWIEHPDRDVLGDIPTIGWAKGTSERLAVPDKLTHTALWAKAEGHGTDVADHPDADSAVRGIGSDGRVRQHLKAAVEHLLRANPTPDAVSFVDHSRDIADKLQGMIEQHREHITGNLASGARHWSEVQEYLAKISDYAHWCLNHPTVLKRKTIKRIKQEQTKAHDDQATAEEIFARVERTIERAFHEASASDVMAKRAELEKQLADMKQPAADLQQRMANMRQRAGLRRQLADLKPPVTLLVAPPGTYKSTLARAAAVRCVTEHPNKTVVIAVPLHKLGAEQIEKLREEFPSAKYRAGVWRGRHADDPLTPDPAHPGKFLKMCQREEDVVLVEDVMVDPDHLCIRGRGKKAVKCPLYDNCAFRRQDRLKGVNIWFLAHECLAHEMPKVLGDVGWIIIDESPLDAFTFGVDNNDQVTLGLDTLCTPLQVADEAKLGVNGYGNLMQAREELYHALDKLQVPAEVHQGAPVPRESLKAFTDIPTGYFITTKNPLFAGTFAYGEILHGDFTDEIPDLDAVRDKYFKTDPKPYIDAAMDERRDPDLIPALDMLLRTKTTTKNDPNLFIDAIYGEFVGFPAFNDMRKLTLRGKFNPEIRPDMSTEQLKNKLQEAAGNTAIKLEAKLWGIIEAAGADKLYGRIQIQRGKKGREIRMVGLDELAAGWNVPTLICDATGDATLLKAIWPQLEEPEPRGWEQLPRPENVRVIQLVDRTMAKWAVEVKSQDPKGPEKKTNSAYGAQRAYAAVLMKALEYGGQEVGVIIDKSAKEWIKKHCPVPKWMKLVHWGEHLGTNILQKVRAQFTIGRWLAPPEMVARQIEALFGGYIAEREYRLRRKGGRIPIVPDAEGNNCILVDVREYAHPLADRAKRQVTEGNIIQAVGRARPGLRGKDEPLDSHLWTDVPVPELGSVEPVLWGELDVGLDGVMLAVGGVWLENTADAVRAYKGLFTADWLREARVDRRFGEGAARPFSFSFWTRGVWVSPIRYPIGKTHTPPFFRVIYQRAASGCKPAAAVFLSGIVDPRGWLEDRLGALANFEIVGWGGKEKVG